VQKTLGRNVGVRHLPSRNEVQHADCDHTEVRELLGMGRSIDLDEGLKRMARWARTVPLNRLRSFYKIEIKKNIPWHEACAKLRTMISY